MADSKRWRLRFLACALVAIGLMTFGSSIKWSLDVGGLNAFPREEPNWQGIIIANALGAESLVVGLTLLIARKTRTVVSLLAVIGLITFAAAIAWCNSLLGFLSFMGGGETKWPNVVLVLTIALLLGAAPLVVGLVLLFRRRKPRGS